MLLISRPPDNFILFSSADEPFEDWHSTLSNMLSSLVMYDSALFLILLYVLTSPIHCTEYDRKCYTVANRKVCFFRPEFNATWYTWYKASSTCRRKNSTLPFIPDKAIQGVFENYMTSLEKLYTDDMWMGGRETRKEGWTWVNDLPFSEPTYFTGTHSESKSVYLQAVLADGLIYRKEFPGNRSCFVCQFTGDACRSVNAISLKKGCVILNDVALDFYDARNNCFEKGGDLAVIDGQDDLNKFQQVFSRIRKTATIWLGLRRQWWYWDVTETAETKYSNWAPEYGFKPDLGCMVYEVNEYQWKQENCTSYQRFICQTGPDDIQTDVPTTPSLISGEQSTHGFIFLVVGVSCLALVILLVIVVAAVTAKKRKTRLRQTAMVTMPGDKSYQHLELRLNGEKNPKSGQIYTGLQTSPKKPPPPPPARPLYSQQTEQSPEPVYDDIIETRGPSYLEITH